MTIDERVEALLNKMTLKEKIGQLHQAGTTMTCALPGFEADIDKWVSEMLQGKLSKEELDQRLAMCEEDLREKEVLEGEQGSFINLYEDEKLAEVLENAKRSRLGIPLFIGVDVIRGYRTMFPTPLAMSCSWDLEMIRQAAHVSKREAWEAGVNWTFGPMLDVARDGRWGRIVESPGEDPYLASRIAQVQVTEFQKEEEDGCRLLATAKHFLAYGAVSGGQDYNTVDLSKRQLYETYLPPFRAAIKAGVGAVMSAFQDLNGVPCTMDRWLLTELLREQLGFEGFVVSDAEAVKQCVVHGAAKDEKEAAKQAFLAGGDMDMGSMDYHKYLEELVREGEVSKEEIEEAARRILKKKMEFGLFEREYVYDAEKLAGINLSKEHRAIAREAGRRSAVLLKNNGTLPIPTAVKKILVVGALADDRQELMGPWSFTGRMDTLITILEGIRAGAPKGTEVSYSRGCEVEESRSRDLELVSSEGTDSVSSGREASETDWAWQECFAKAKEADFILAVAGENAFMSGEAASRADLHLAGRQEEFLLKLAELGRPLAVVLVNGRPLAIGRLQKHPGIGAILESWHLGTEFGHAVADLLFGIYNPSGKLTTTWANEAGQEPMYYNHPNTGKPGSDFKFTSKYQDVPVMPLYPFGYGLSYTNFAYFDLQIKEKKIRMDGALKCSVWIENTGDRMGEEVVQCYVRDLTASIVRPVRELKGFQKIQLQPGEGKQVNFTIPIAELGFYNRECVYVVEPGTFRLYIGPNSMEGLEQEFEVVTA